MYVDALVVNMNVGIVNSMAILGIGGVGLRAQYNFFSPNPANRNLVVAISMITT